jgi:hypothetical protein
MKLELTEETSAGTNTMYCVRNDGYAIKWFANKNEAEAFYDSLVADPSLLENKKIILKSQEIDLPLEK